jgi:molybdopterin-guanine dinucleotide biosynthesis protein B
LAKVLQSLKRSDIVATHRGIGGGISLIAEPAQLTILDIIAAVDPSGASANFKQMEPGGYHQGKLHQRLEVIRILRENVLRETSLKDLMSAPDCGESGASPPLDTLLDHVRRWPGDCPPRIHIVGHKNSGKTTLIEQLVEHYCSQGIRIGTVKHTHHRHELDTPGKDSFRHRKAGAAAVGILSPGMDALFLPHTTPADSQSRYESLGMLFRDCDLMLIEGGLHDKGIKVEVWRKEVVTPLALSGHPIEALITDDDPPDDTIQRWSRNDIAGLAIRLLERARVGLPRP